MNPKVDIFLTKAKNWQPELEQLRAIILSCGLNEELKWRQPCYTFNGNNIVLISGFKAYCALSFFKGVLLNDTDGILQKPGEHTQSSRLIKFTFLQEIVKLKNVLETYIYEAIEVEKAGLKVKLKASTDYDIPEELQKKLDENPALQTAFAAITPGRQKAYLLYFSAAKQSKTRTARVEKYTPQILDGYGINDCTCGLSKRMPTCDGSHKYLHKKNP